MFPLIGISKKKISLFQRLEHKNTDLGMSMIRAEVFSSHQVA